MECIMQASWLSPDNINTVSKILDMDKYNGRINLMTGIDPDVRFRMQEKIHLRNKATQYREALNGDIEWNVLAQVFFCAENIQIIQNGLRAGVYNMSAGQYNVPNQNIDTLKIIMRGVYMNHAEHNPVGITEQVERLNKRVLDYAIPNVYNEAVAYMNYLRDQSTIATPLSLPVQNDRVYKQLELKRYI